MKLSILALVLVAAPIAGAGPATGGETGAPAPAVVAAEWHMNATIIEACSCPMFCQCYFNAKPADHVGCCPPGSDPKSAPRNDGFVLMANEVEAYRAGDKPWEFKGTNGFMITFDIASTDAGGGKKGY